MERRTLLATIGSAAAVGAAGCLGDSDDTNGNGDDGDVGGDAGQNGTDDDTVETVGEWAEGEVEFGLPPFQDAEDLADQYGPTFDYLEDHFDGVDSVEGTQTTSYAATVESVVGGHTEMANLSPIIYTLALEDGVEPVAMNWSHGSDAYHTYIATREDTGIESLSDLEGKTIAMVDTLSTSGGLFPRYMLAQAGLDVGDINTPPEDVAFNWSGGHDASLAALENEHVDAAAYGDFQHPDDDAIVKIAESDPIPFDPVVVKPGTPEPVQEAITEALLDTPEEALDQHRIDRFGEVEPGTYDPVRDVAVEMGVDIETLEADDE